MTLADEIALWGMIGSWISGVATFVAAVFAWKALSGWRSQEKRNDRKALKIALVQYRNLLTIMPEKLVPGEDFAQPAFAIQDAMNKIYEAIVIMEVNLKEDKLGKIFVELNNMHSEFMRGNVHRDELARMVIPFMTEKFIDK